MTSLAEQRYASDDAVTMIPWPQAAKLPFDTMSDIAALPARAPEASHLDACILKLSFERGRGYVSMHSLRISAKLAQKGIVISIPVSHDGNFALFSHRNHAEYALRPIISVGSFSRRPTFRVRPQKACRPVAAINPRSSALFFFITIQ